MKRLKHLVVAGAAAVIVGASVAPASAAIYCEQVSPCIRVTDVTVTEGNSGTRSAAFEIKLAPAASYQMTIHYRTGGGSARAGADYSSRSGSVSFQPGESTKVVSVPVLGDVVDEPNETFSLEITSAGGGQIQDGRGQATIADDDPSQPAPPPPTCPPSLPNCQEP
jgi:hypothetical protein